MAELQLALEDPALRTQALTILRGLIDYVEVTPADEGFELEFVGEIANMIGLPSGKDSKNLDRYDTSVKVVAGARNHRELTLAAVAI